MTAELEALATLLDDESPTIARAVGDRLLALGEDATPTLRTLAIHGTARQRSRAREVLLRMERPRWHRRLVELATRPDPDLEEGAILIAQAHAPGLDGARISADLDAMAETLRPAVAAALRGEARLRVFLRGVHDTLGFRGDREGYENLANSVIDGVLARRRGIPITLGLVYALLGRRLGLRVSCVGTPGHALAFFEEGRYRAWIDAFDRGQIWSEDKALAFLAHKGYQGLEARARLRPMPGRAVLERMVRNLVNFCGRLGLDDERARFLDLAGVLALYRERDLRAEET